jgi:hypothetical protein
MINNKTITARVINRPTPFRNAVLAVSLTCNVFLGTYAYAVYSGQLARTDVVVAEPVNLYSENYISTLEREKR